MDLPSGRLSAGATERGWRKDRGALVRCKDRHGALVTYYRERDAGLAGE